MRILQASLPSLALAVLVFGLASPAFADVPPGPRERTTRTVEPQKAPPMTPPREEQPQPEQPQAPASAEPPTPQTAPPQAADQAKTAKDEKSGSCSIAVGSEQDLGTLAALVVLVVGGSLLRRRG